MKPGYTEHRILIWGKTYPELSKKYIETVCTAGVLESGKPVRLYPITYRYLNDEQFKLYQWITAGIQKNPNDTRPESFNSQPIQLDGNGCATIYGVGSYRQQLYDGPVVGGNTSGTLIFDKLTTDTSAFNSTFWAGLSAGTANVITIVDP